MPGSDPNIHRHLERQLKRLGISADEAPDRESWQCLLKTVSRHYDDTDQARYTLERSLEVSSTEMRELYDGLRDTSAVLQMERDRLEGVISAVGDGILLTGVDGVIHILNRSMAEITGLRAADVPDAPSLFERLGARAVDRGGDLRSFWDLMLDDSVHQVEAAVRTPAGDERVLMVYKSMMTDADERLVFGVFHDITVRKEAEAEIVRLKTFYERVLNEIPLQIEVLDSEGRFIFVNPSSASSESMRSWLIGKTDFDYSRVFKMSQEVAAERSGYLGYVVAEQQPVEWEESDTDQDGRVHHALCKLAPIQGTEAGELRLVRYRVDVTDLRAIEGALRDAKEQAENASRTKSAFLANVSHELRTPLNAIIGFTSLMLRTLGTTRDTVTPDDLIYLGRVRENGTHLLQLINDVLDLSKVEAGEVTLRPSKVNVCKTIDGVAAQFMSQVEGKKLLLRVELPDIGVEVRPITADALRFKQVLMNLVANAVKFTEVGEVVIAMEIGPSGTPQTIYVRDTGIGIREDRIGTVFESFRQADDSITKRFGGTGLGLSISRQLCNQMGFELRAESTPDEGSTFIIDLAPGEPRQHLAAA